MQTWNPYLKRDKDKLEKVQHSATKMIHELRNKSYVDRLAETQLTTLEQRRIRGDLIETFKMIKGLTNVNYMDFFTIVSKNKTRGHSLKLEKQRARFDLRKYSFSHPNPNPNRCLTSVSPSNDSIGDAPQTTLQQ